VYKLCGTMIFRRKDNMTPEELRRIVSGEQIIEGIHNYCNRWCERCPFRRRCSVFLTEEAAGLTEHVENPEARPPDMEQALANMSDMFALTQQMMEEDAKEQGLDWDAIMKEAEETPPRERRDEPQFVTEAKDYAMAMLQWLEESRKAFEERGEEPAAAAEAALPGADPETEAEKIHDALEVIQWYLFQIHVKLTRAVGFDEVDDEPEDEENDDLQSDRNGSARVALQGLDESIAAWEVLRRAVPALGEVILSQLATLARIRKKTEAMFPRARAFRRPGFDDPKYAELMRQFKPERGQESH
jgi:hypothetical protein